MVEEVGGCFTRVGNDHNIPASKSGFPCEMNWEAAVSRNDTNRIVERTIKRGLVTQRTRFHRFDSSGGR